MRPAPPTGLIGAALGGAVIDHLLTYPDSHDQKVVICGGVGCIAGWAIRLHYGFAHASEWWIIDDPWVEAARLLQLPQLAFEDLVYNVTDRNTAITNLKELLNSVVHT